MADQCLHVEHNDRAILTREAPPFHRATRDLLRDRGDQYLSLNVIRKIQIPTDKGNAFEIYGYRQLSTSISLSLALVFCTYQERKRARPLMSSLFRGHLR